jgi:hypothetical protein
MFVGQRVHDYRTRYASAQDRYGVIVAVHRIGRKWSIQRMPAPGSGGAGLPAAVSCPSSTTCFAVGAQDLVASSCMCSYEAPLIER